MHAANDIKVVFQTRFSFFGQSGWRSDTAADPMQLFDADRLEARFRYFEMITLPSLVSQTDLGFEHMVLSSTLMPEHYQRRLRELVNDTLGEERARVMFRPEGKAGVFLRMAVQKNHGDNLVAQIVLDDDDAVALDFVEAVRSRALSALGDTDNPEDYVYLSFPRGFTLGLKEGRPTWMERRYVPYTNLGLTLMAPGTATRNPFMVSHKKVGERHPSVMITHLRPYYLRAVHGHNDSRAMTQQKGMRTEDMDAALKYFPFLNKHFRPALGAGVTSGVLAAQ